MNPTCREQSRYEPVLKTIALLAPIERRVHPAPFRTRKLSASSPMILHIYVWEGRPGPTLFATQKRFEILSRSAFAALGMQRLFPCRGVRLAFYLGHLCLYRLRSVKSFAFLATRKNPLHSGRNAIFRSVALLAFSRKGAGGLARGFGPFALPASRGAFTSTVLQIFTIYRKFGMEFDRRW